MTGYTLVDTDIFIDIRRGQAAAAEYLDSLAARSPIALSIVSNIEIIVGCRNEADMDKFERLLQRYRVLTLDEMISTQALNLLHEYRLSHGLQIAASLIAATAICWEMPLASRNQRRFHYISNLEFVPYTQ